MHLCGFKVITLIEEAMSRVLSVEMNDGQPVRVNSSLWIGGKWRRGKIYGR